MNLEAHSMTNNMVEPQKMDQRKKLDPERQQQLNALMDELQKEADLVKDLKEEDQDRSRKIARASQKVKSLGDKLAAKPEPPEMKALRQNAEECIEALKKGYDPYPEIENTKQTLAEVAKCRLDDTAPCKSTNTNSASLQDWRPPKLTYRSSPSAKRVEKKAAEPEDEEEKQDNLEEEEDMWEDAREELQEDGVEISAQNRILSLKALADEATTAGKYEDGMLKYRECLEALTSQGLAPEDPELHRKVLANYAFSVLKFVGAKCRPWRTTRALASDALDACNQGLAIDKCDAKLHFRRGQALECLQRSKEAFEAYANALDLMPDDPKIREASQRVASYLEERKQRRTVQQHGYPQQPLLKQQQSLREGFEVAGGKGKLGRIGRGDRGEQSQESQQQEEQQQQELNRTHAAEVTAPNLTGDDLLQSEPDAKDAEACDFDLMD